MPGGEMGSELFVDVSTELRRNGNKNYICRGNRIIYIMEKRNGGGKSKSG